MPLPEYGDDVVLKARLKLDYDAAHPLPVTGTVTAAPATLGQKAMAASMAVALASDQTAVPVAQTAGDAWAVSQPGLTANAPVCILIPACVSTITANTKAAASVVTTAAAHGLTSGESVTIAGSNSTTTINGVRVVTVISPTTFSVPVDTSGGASAGTAGTVTWGSVAGSAAKLIDATAGRVGLVVATSPLNPSYVFVGAAATITPSNFTTAVYHATDGVPIPAGGSKAIDAATAYYATSISAAYVYVEVLVQP